MLCSRRRSRLYIAWEGSRPKVGRGAARTAVRNGRKEYGPARPPPSPADQRRVSASRRALRSCHCSRLPAANSQALADSVAARHCTRPGSRRSRIAPPSSGRGRRCQRNSSSQRSRPARPRSDLPPRHRRYRTSAPRSTPPGQGDPVQLAVRQRDAHLHAALARLERQLVGAEAGHRRSAGAPSGTSVDRPVRSSPGSAPGSATAGDRRFPARPRETALALPQRRPSATRH